MRLWWWAAHIPTTLSDGSAKPTKTLLFSCARACACVCVRFDKALGNALDVGLKMCLCIPPTDLLVGEWVASGRVGESVSEWMVRRWSSSECHDGGVSEAATV